MFHDTFSGLHHYRGMLLVKQSVLGTWWAGTKDGVPSKLPLLCSLIKILFVFWHQGAHCAALRKKCVELTLDSLLRKKSYIHWMRMSLRSELFDYKPLHTSAVSRWATSHSLSGCLNTSRVVCTILIARVIHSLSVTRGMNAKHKLCSINK